MGCAFIVYDNLFLRILFAGVFRVLLLFVVCVAGLAPLFPADVQRAKKIQTNKLSYAMNARPHLCANIANPKHSKIVSTTKWHKSPQKTPWKQPFPNPVFSSTTGFHPKNSFYRLKRGGLQIHAEKRIINGAARSLYMITYLSEFFLPAMPTFYFCSLFT